MDNYNEFCKSKECEHYIQWEFVLDHDCQPYICSSCKKVGQSYEIDKYPPDCPFLDEIKLVNIGE